VIDNLLVVGKDMSIEAQTRMAAKTVYSAEDLSEAAEIVKTADLQSILIDSTVSPWSACVFADELRRRSPNIAMVLIRKDDDPEVADKLRQAGIIGLAAQSFTAERLLRAFREQQQASGQGEGNRTSRSLDAMIGASPAMGHARRMLRVVAQSGCNPVLIVGETGTGKELAARSVHELRHGDSARFVAINCAALTASLLESELFGHAKGAFTGADSEKTGLLELAGNGTVFLDEISEMPLELQAKLLRVLQERIFRKVGGTAELQCTATVVASSNRNLLAEVDAGKFRRDLYYRLSVCPITLPPLRSENRKADIPALVEHFIRTSDIHPQKSKAIKGMTNLALEALLRHNWPGNVRELKNVIDRAVLLETSDRIGLNNVVIHPDDISHDMTKTCQQPMADFSLEKAEQELITRALQETGWQKSRAASLLGITRATLYAKVKQYAIQPATEEPCEVAAGQS
jgi:two-component system, NtrC family, response regulator HydG